MKAIALPVLFLLAVPAAAQEETVGIRLREWYARLEGDLEVQGPLIPATSIDARDDLGLGRSEFAHEIQAYLAFPMIGRFLAGGWVTRLEGDKTLSRTIIFDDRSFTFSTPVKTELDIAVGYLTYEFPLVPPSLGAVVGVDVGIQAGVRGIAAEGSIESPLLSASDSVVGALPVLGARAGFQAASWLRGDVELVGMSFAYSSWSATYVEASVEAVVQPYGGLFGGLGYRFVALDLSDHGGSTEVDLDIDLQGLYFTAGIRF